MKNLVMVLLALVSGMAAASSIVCSSEKVYYSDVRTDFGAKPPAGTATGSFVILYENKVLLSYIPIEGLHPFGWAPYSVGLVDQKTVLESGGNATDGYEVFRQMAVVSQIDSMTGKLIKEIGREEAVCKRLWKNLP